MFISKLAVIQQCIFNDIEAQTELQCHLDKLYQMRDEELKANGIELEEWEAHLKRLFELWEKKQ